MLNTKYKDNDNHNYTNNASKYYFSEQSKTLGQITESLREDGKVQVVVSQFQMMQLGHSEIYNQGLAPEVANGRVYRNQDTNSLPKYPPSF